MRILWLDLNSSYSHSSLALPALHSQLEGDAGLLWSVVRATVGEPPGEIASRVYAESPDIIAATCWLFTRSHLLSVLSRCRALLPDVRVILGGPEFLGDNEEFLRRNSFVECVFRGEGEESFPKWLSVMDDSSRWNGIPGLCWISFGEYHDNGIARVMDFQSLKNPEESRFFCWDKAFVQLETTRGCFNTCSFCVSGGEKPVRTVPLEKVRERLDVIRRNGIRDVRMLDRTFNHDNDRAVQMLRMFREFSPGMRFHLEVHPALMNGILRRELASLPAGLLHIEAGIQSLDASVLELCGRAGSLAKSLEGLEFLCSLGNVEVHADLIAGLPGYRPGQLFEDVKTLAGLGVDEIQLESLKVLPGTRMRRMASEWGVIYSREPPYEVLRTNEISPEELGRAMSLSRMLDFYYNAPAWRKVFRKMILSGCGCTASVPGNGGFLESFLDYLISLDVISMPLSLERRGIILYEFCRLSYPEFSDAVSIAWIEAGMSLKKSPAGNVVRVKNLSGFVEKNGLHDVSANVLYGSPEDNLRYYWLPDSSVDETPDVSGNGAFPHSGHLFGFDADDHKPFPVYCAEYSRSGCNPAHGLSHVKQ